ncbi:MAG: hypothetical protein V3U75_02575 [Methylococcaceae bacterium]
MNITYNKQRIKIINMIVRLSCILAAILPFLTQAADSTTPTTRQKELQLQIKQRDVLIKDLLKRVEALENKEIIKQDQPPQSQASTKKKPKTTSTTKTKTSAAPKDTSKKPAPGQFEIDEQAAQRALERTLAISGALLLPAGYIDTDVNFTYSRFERQEVATKSDDIRLVKINQDIFQPSLSFRLGLPFESQLEMSLPYQFKNQSDSVEGNFEEKKSGSGLGDLSVGIAKTLLHQSGWIPDLIALIRWDSDSGVERDGDVSLNGGIHQLSGSLTALIRQDPLAFFLGANYGSSFEENDGFKPGNTLGFTVGAQLAASSSTSLSFALSQSFISRSKAAFEDRIIHLDNDENGQPQDPVIKPTHPHGSSQTISILSIGATSRITRNTFVNLNAGMGLTDDAPDYTVGITISTRNNLGAYLGL